MSNRKGLSFDEKRHRLTELFYETKEVYTLKELEKIAPKQKGIVSQSVKEVLESLVSDDIVSSDKIGTSNYFWAFPSTALIVRENKLNKYQEELDGLTKQREELQLKIADAQIGREECDERADLLAKLSSAETKRMNQMQELQQYADNDPATLQAKRDATKIAKDAANRWTESIMSIQSYCTSKFGVDLESFNAQFEIPQDLDTYN
ncbi:hypothetical protein MP228_009812 [Amoeboaphelidium protococcarum]|nr:hypothetical protein MP228_009812 [Amoeboaphelidium protococcarum]